MDFSDVRTPKVYLYLSFDAKKPSRAFCGIYAPSLSEAESRKS